METERLRQFCAIADTGSLTQAAEILNISLGGLSKSIKVLENEIGFALFVPFGRGLTISEKGLAFYGKAKKVLDSVAELVATEDSTYIPFRIGMLEVFSVYFMGKIVERNFPRQSIELIERSPGEIEMLLVNRQIDCGLTYLPYPQPGVEVLKIGSFELLAFASLFAQKNIS